MAFNPDKYLEEKAAQTPETSTFNPDAYLSEKTGYRQAAAVSPEITKLESALRGGAEGATLGFAPQIAGAAETAPKALHALTGGDSIEDLLKAYRASRDDSKAKFRAAEEANPKSYMAGSLAGSLAPAIVTGGLTEAPSAGSALLQGAKLGAKYGAVSGIANSDADLTKGEIGPALKDAAIGAGQGALLGGIVGKGGSKLKELPEELQQIAAERAVKSTGIGKAQLKNILKQDIKQNAYNASQQNPEKQDSILKMGKLLLDKNPYQESPVVSPLANTSQMLERAQDLAHKSGADIGDILKKLDSNQTIGNPRIGAKFFNPSNAAAEIEQQLLVPLQVNGQISPVAKPIASTIQNVLDSIKQYGDGPIPFEKAQELKQMISGLANYETEGSANNQILKRSAGIINKQIEDAADNVVKDTGQSDLVDRYKKAKDLYKASQTAVNAGVTKEAGNMVNRDAGITDYMAGGLGAVAHGAGTGILAATGNKLAKTYGNPLLATGANATSNILSGISKSLTDTPKAALGNLGKQLSSSGNVLEAKLGNILSQASEKDDTGRNALIFSLMQNSAYRDLLKKYMGQKEEGVK